LKQNGVCVLRIFFIRDNFGVENLEKRAEAEQGCHFGRSRGAVKNGPTLGLE
jgi:hypothetical protein